MARTAPAVIHVIAAGAHRQSGAVYQPLYLGPRDDIPAEDCTVAQLKFKQEALVL